MPALLALVERHPEEAETQGYGGEDVADVTKQELDRGRAPACVRVNDPGPDDTLARSRLLIELKAEGVEEIDEQP
jgi:hypothetical protein